MELRIFSTDFGKNTQISNFMKNPSSGSRVVPWGGRDSQTLRSWWSLVAILRKAPETGITNTW